MVEMSKSDNGKARRATAVYFGICGNPKSKKHLKPLLKDESARIRSNAIGSYGRIIHPELPFDIHTIEKKAESVPPEIKNVIPLLKDKNTKVSMRALIILSHYHGLNNADVEKALKDATKDSQHKIQHKASITSGIPCPKCGK